MTKIKEYFTDDYNKNPVSHVFFWRWNGFGEFFP